MLLVAMNQFRRSRVIFSRVLGFLLDIQHMPIRLSILELPHSKEKTRMLHCCLHRDHDIKKRRPCWLLNLNLPFCAYEFMHWDGLRSASCSYFVCCHLCLQELIPVSKFNRSCFTLVCKNTNISISLQFSSNFLLLQDFLPISMHHYGL